MKLHLFVVTATAVAHAAAAGVYCRAGSDDSGGRCEKKSTKNHKVYSFCCQPKASGSFTLYRTRAERLSPGNDFPCIGTAKYLDYGYIYCVTDPLGPP
ncbi:uncharacterized protein UV8b_07245 [Ustilaginoidea virens]|uniref:Uncharacterized protein n=1 Tax=Ustilaginoidea virens TaxID=1159556 RepID=A0A8E5HWR7_USTVR|nr:uncharacterized protein UV8b_07245 [Ustilaginoidea virens]QUC23004.1 hypothetical protein UV8b_07245 [Ustilaginoidea virens]